MSTFGNIYSDYYDLLYHDKNYDKEADYINTLIQKYSSNCTKILDLGCGTGIHDELLSKNGYKIHGVDLSEEMLVKANEKSKVNTNLSFEKADITNFNNNEKYDVVVSLFHVISYQITNSQLIDSLKTAYNHLKEGGVFIFDFWYGPAVLNDQPVTRIKRVSNDTIKVTRLAEPEMFPKENRVIVNYEIFLENLKSGNISTFKESHNMRYLFDQELELICNDISFKIKDKYHWLTNNSPDINSWNVVWILEK